MGDPLLILTTPTGRRFAVSRLEGGWPEGIEDLDEGRLLAELKGELTAAFADIDGVTHVMFAGPPFHPPCGCIRGRSSGRWRVGRPPLGARKVADDADPGGGRSVGDPVALRAGYEQLRERWRAVRTAGGSGMRR